MLGPRIFVYLLALVATATFSSIAAADPTDVATDFFVFIQNEEYESAAELYDPSELREFRDLLRFIYEPAENPNKKAIDELLKVLFGEGSNRDDISKLSDAKFFASWLAFSMSDAEVTMPGGFRNLKNIGYVNESPDLAHALIRFDVNYGELQTPISIIEIVSVRLVDDEWLLLVPAESKALAEQLKVKFGPN